MNCMCIRVCSGGSRLSIQGWPMTQRSPLLKDHFTLSYTLHLYIPLKCVKNSGWCAKYNINVCFHNFLRFSTTFFSTGVPMPPQAPLKNEYECTYVFSSVCFCVYLCVYVCVCVCVCVCVLICVHTCICIVVRMCLYF